MSLATSLLASFGLVAGLTVLSAAPAVAHPEECQVTDDAAVDEDCEGKDAGDESGEAQYLDDSDQVLTPGPDGVFETSPNMTALGFSERAVPLSGPGSAAFNSDLAFSGKNVIQGTYQGFRIVDASDPANPREIVNFEDCVSGNALGSQGDIVVQGNILLRSWDAPRPTALDCGGVNTPANTEGLHVFDISDPANPVAQSFVPLPCGSHTASAVPDPANGRLLVYNSASSSAFACRGIDIVSVPLDNPAAATYLRFVRSGDPGNQFPDVVTVTDGAAEGSYGAARSGFGPSTTEVGTSGTIVAASQPLACTPIDGTDPMDPVATGSIVLVDRGVCPFTEKVKNAQNAGAAAVLIANNGPGAIFGPGGTDATIKIPSAMISQADGATIRAGLPATGTLAANPPVVTDTPDRACHDTGVILGGALMAGCAGGNGVTMYTMDPAKGGSLEEPKVVYSRSFPGVTIGHSAAFTWDGKVLVYGHEPGGGSQARCQERTPEVDRTLFFLEAATGKTLGTFISPRPQTDKENCTWHNYNVVPTDKGYVMVSGNYQSGISVIDFTDPAAPREIAFADPKPLSETSLITGGDWSTYWYDGFIYQSDIRRGLIIWKLDDPAVAGAKKLGALNPQTQETTIPLKVRPKPKKA
jgi:hypothetical protein